MKHSRPAHLSPYDKRQSLLYLLKKHNVTCFVETGTYRGETVAFLEPEVECIHSIELDDALYRTARQRFVGKPRIRCWHGCSGTLLAEVINQCWGPILFWLDGHYSGGNTALGEEVSPILKEIAQISQSPNADQHCILIDDVRLFDGISYPSLSDTLAFIDRHLPHHHVEVYNDMMFVEPPADVSQMSDEGLSLAYRYAPRKIISRNQSYQLYCGPNYDRDAAWRAGYQDADCVSSVYASKACRFGNSVQQWKNLLGIALHHDLRRIYLPGFWWIKQGVFTLACGIEVVNQTNAIMADEEVILSGLFYNIDSLQTFSSIQHTHVDAIEHLRGSLLVQPSGDVLESSHLVIHIRAGDIFTGRKIHPLYGQPPLAFYLNVLASENWQKVTLVAENAASPVWAPLVAYCHEHYSCEVRVGQALSEDISFLLRAHTIVTANGTFSPGLSCLSPYWQRVITFESDFPSWGNNNFRWEIWKDSLGDYHASILSRNWANRPEQRDMMLNYQKEKICKFSEQGI